MRPWYLEPNQRARVLQSFRYNTPFIIFDIEGTGLNTAKDHIIELGAKKCVFKDGKAVCIDSIDEYINPGVKVSREIEELTGITNDFLADKQDERSGYEKIKAFFGDYPVVMAYNKTYDIPMLSTLYERFDDKFRYRDSFDVCVMARDLVSKSVTGDRKLGTIARYFGADEGLEFHRAVDDVEATRRIFEKFYELYKNDERIEPVREEDYAQMSLF